MGSDRTTVKSNITTINVPSVSNADLNDMLQDNICDSVVFLEDDVNSQTAISSNITLDFTDKDRINLRRIGGSLIITITGLEDGATKYILITKSSGQNVSFVGTTDITQLQANTDIATTLVYAITRKGSNYFAKALYLTVEAASNAETQAGSIDNKFVTPAGLESKVATTTAKGIVELATGAETATGTDTERAVTPDSLTSRTASTLRTGLIEIATSTEAISGTGSFAITSGNSTSKGTWTSLSSAQGTNWDCSNLYYRKNILGDVEIKGYAKASGTWAIGNVTIATLPAGYRPANGVGQMNFNVIQLDSSASTRFARASVSINDESSGGQIFISSPSELLGSMGINDWIFVSGVLKIPTV